MLMQDAIFYFSDGSTKCLDGQVAKEVYERFKNNQIAPNGIINFDDATIFVSHIIRIDWNFES